MAAGDRGRVMEILTTIVGCRERRRAEREAGHRVALVPTMGFLHEGHLELVRTARRTADRVWVSIFVNPTQFGPDEDYESYPRELERDAELLKHEGVDVIFAPSADEMYPREPIVEIGFSGLEHKLCGTDRPTHFAGVGIVVSQLFNVVQPDAAVFGQKDAQQVLLIRRLAHDLHFPVEIIVNPTVREQDGLAMSSRNAYLKPNERAAAPAIYHALCRGRELVEQGESSACVVRDGLIRGIESEELLKVQYAECVDADSLQDVEMIDGPVLLAVGVRVGMARLIDNVVAVPGSGPEGEA